LCFLFKKAPPLLDKIQKGKKQILLGKNPEGPSKEQYTQVMMCNIITALLCQTKNIGKNT